MTDAATESPTTFVQWLEPEKVGFDVLADRHGPLLELPRRMLGVVPNCHPYLEIWPTALRTYNLLVPNFLNMPLVMWGVGAPPALVGLAMYTASRTAECMYCSAHSCTFAMRRGLGAGVAADALDPDGKRSEAERAVIVVAQGISTMPASLGGGELEALRSHVSAAHAEWITIAAVMMGFLNKCMSTLGVALEAAVADDVRDVISDSGWTPGHHEVLRDERPTFSLGTDSLSRKLGIIPLLPGAVLRERQWIKGVPGSWPEAGRYLEERVGYDFPVLAGPKPARVVRALTTMIRDNLDPERSEVGIEAKVLAGLAFSVAYGSESLLEICGALVGRESSPVSAEGRKEIERWAGEPTDFDDGEALASARERLEAIEGVDAATGVVLLWGKAMAQNPGAVTPALLERSGAHLTRAGTVELLVWASILQLLQRLSVAFPSAQAS